MEKIKSQKRTTINKKLKIILRSDLCVGSGFSYAGIIDSDVSYNKNGLPFISGRRLKGCMKEAAESIGINDISKIFGTGGENDVNGIYIGNAFPESTSSIMDILSKLQKRTNKYSKYLNHENILKQFTSVKAQTMIGDDGIATENSLRFTRTINQYDSIKKTNMVFETDLSYEYTGENDTIIEDLEKIVKATRNIGLNRNRGLGSVKMELLDKDNKNIEIKIIDLSKKNGKKKISYRIKNIQPLLMSGKQNDVTENYISGTSVLGVFAKEYLKDGNADSDEFRKMFLEGNIIFSNLTLAEKITKKEKEHWITTYPAPLYINRLKKTKKLVNIAADIPSLDNIEKKEKNKEEILDSEYSSENGNQPKKLKTQFLLYYNGKYDIKEVKKEIIYHHTKKVNSKNNKKELLYFLEAIEENQYFSGEIIVKNDYLEKIKELLKKIKIRFGKSKSAQYGLCEIEPNSVILEDYTPVKATKLKAGTKILVTLISDGIFVNEKGIYTIEHDEVRKLIAKKLNLEDVSKELSKDTKSFLQTKVLTGFHTKWNLSKQQIPIIQAGSAFEYTLTKDLLEYEEYIGEKNSEGFGKCRITSLNDVKYCLEEMENETDKENDTILKKEQKSYFGKLFRKILLEEFSAHIKGNAFNNKKINITPSALGRLDLMLTEVINETEEPMDRYVLLRKRIDSIKSKDTQREIMRFLTTIIGKDVFTEEEKNKFKDMKKDIWKDIQKRKEQQEIIVEKITKKNNETKNLEEYDLLLQSFDKNLVNALVFELWSGYFKDVLIYQKYLKKGEEIV